MELLIFIICISASTIGAIVGAGGGVIIKPVMDMLGLFPVSTTSFCSGCTVLGMSLSSLIRNRKNGVTLNIKTSTSLAIGSVAGGFIGKWMFELIRNNFSDEHILGAIQAACLTIITFFVFIYICRKNSIPSKHVTNTGITIIIGTFLGIISSFLGIGGGPYNVAILFFFFSMNAKEAAKNSLYIIVFSQITSIATAIYTQSVPNFNRPILGLMITGGIGGAIIGSRISSKISNQGIERLLKILSLIIVFLDFYNVLKYTVL